MFVDPLAVMLLGVAGSAVLIAYYLIASTKHGRLLEELSAPMFALGAFDFLSGFYMSFFWPLPPAYNMLFGDPMLMLGIIMLAGGFALYKGIDPRPISLLGFLLGIYLFAESYGMYAFKLEPPQDLPVALSFYLASALSAILSPLVYTNPKKGGKAAYYLLAVIVVIAAFLALLIGITSIIGHLQSPP